MARCAPRATKIYLLPRAPAPALENGFLSAPPPVARLRSFPPRARLSKRPPLILPCGDPTERPPNFLLTEPPAFLGAASRAPPSFLSLASEATFELPPEYQVPPPILRVAAFPAIRILQLCSDSLQRFESKGRRRRTSRARSRINPHSPHRR